MPEEMRFEKVPLTDLALKGIVPEISQPRPVVLVVDDEIVIADTLTVILARKGFVAITAYDGLTAFEIAKIIPPDLLLSDVVMPGLNGVELAMAIRQVVTDCKVLLFSGQAATVDLLAQARAAGHSFTTIEKPVHPTELLVRISESLGIQQANQERLSA
jgi:DNA-binding response OmpR family regulator